MVKILLGGSPCTYWSISKTKGREDWEMHIVGMDEQITGRIQEQVNSVSSLVEQPGLTQKEYDAQERERQMERLMHGSEIFNGGATEKTPEEVERLMQESYS